MIFFTQNIEPFISNSGMNVSPTPCTLTDNREGFYFAVNTWNSELEAKGAVLEQITREDILLDEIELN